MPKNKIQNLAGGRREDPKKMGAVPWESARMWGWAGVLTRTPISRGPKFHLKWAEASEEEGRRVNKAEEDRTVGEMWDIMGMGRNRNEPRREPAMKGTWHRKRKAGRDGQEEEARNGEVGQGSVHSRRGLSPGLGHSTVDSDVGGL